MISNKTKAFLIIFVSCMFGVSGVFAAASCNIDQGPTEDLADYLDTLDAALAKIDQSYATSTCGNTADGKARASSSISAAASEIIKDTNRVISQDDYISAGKFSISLILRSEIPYAIREHYNLLLREQDKINATIDRIYATCGEKTLVSPSLLGDEDYAKGKSDKIALSTLIGDILQNHIRIIGFYRESVVGIPPTKSGFLIVDDDFETSIPTDYGPAGTAACNQKWDAFKKISEAIDRIGTMGDFIGKHSDDWKAGWALLHADSADYSAEMKAKITAELARQWLSGHSSTLTIRSFTNYFTSESSRGISGLVEDLGSRLNLGFRSLDPAFDAPEKDLNESKSTDEYLARYKNISALKTDISREIMSDYLSLTTRIGDENLTTDETMGHLAAIYTELDTTTKMLAPYRKIAKDTCNQQTQNESGNCTGK